MNIEIKDYNPKTHYFGLADMVVNYYQEVNQENYLEEVPQQMPDGRFMPVKKVDLKLNSLLLEGIQCKVALSENDLIGFLWYRQAFKNLIICIEALYSRPGFRVSKIGMHLVNSLCNEINQGFFKIYALIHDKNKPNQMLNSWKNHFEVRRKFENDLIMLEGDWDVHYFQNKEKKKGEKVIHPENFKSEEKRGLEHGN
jgi:hypothetical protein